MADADRDYYQQRATVERDLAAKAADPSIARLHRQLAENYAALVDGSFTPRLGIVVRS